MMKRILIASFLLTVITLTSVLGTAYTGSQPDKPEAGDAPEPVQLAADAERTVRVLIGDKTEKMSVFDYLVGVLAAEMPVSFEPEALKAQAVAARSFLQRSIEAGRHGNADICTSIDCCQAFISESELKESWGENYALYVEKLKTAVSETDGEYLSYDGAAALTAFHSSSAGATESSEAVWDKVPYLVSVDSPESRDDVPNYISRVKLADIDFRDTVLYLRPEADMTGDADKWVSKVERNESGRVEYAVIGGEKFSGTELRSLFKLRSTAFRIKHSDGCFTFTVTGYGHGVGMSQYGANVMAKDGSGYEAILAHYYPGTTLSSLRSECDEGSRG